MSARRWAQLLAFGVSAGIVGGCRQTEPTAPVRCVRRVIVNGAGDTLGVVFVNPLPGRLRCEP